MLVFIIVGYIVVIYGKLFLFNLCYVIYIGISFYNISKKNGINENCKVNDYDDLFW